MARGRASLGHVFGANPMLSPTQLKLLDFWMSKRRNKLLHSSGNVANLVIAEF